MRKFLRIFVIFYVQANSLFALYEKFWLIVSEGERSRFVEMIKEKLGVPGDESVVCKDCIEFRNTYQREVRYQ